MDIVKLNSVYFEKLKGLNDITIKFEKPLTAIMGVNGAGKTTVIHALACLYQPDGNGENYKFPYFFIPNTDATWKNSRLVAEMSSIDKSGAEKKISRIYKKDFDRWSPRYENRPLRNIYYIGINSCLPEIEQTNKISSINYTSKDCEDRISKKVIDKAAYILNKEYSTLTDNIYQGKSIVGITTKNGLKYSSLSMGSGEQRTIRILKKVYEAEANSLILIDEIDLLMHVSALRNIIKVLYEIAVVKKLQIVFTTHSLEMCSLGEYVGIQYINTVKSLNGKIKSFVYDRIDTDLVYSLTGQSTYPIKIYVEDEFAKGVVKSLVCAMGLSSKVSITKFGAITNGFTLAAGIFLSGISTENLIIILDGDKYCSDEDKLEQIKNILSGTENDIEDKREQVLNLLTEFKLPKSTKPEEFFYNCLLEEGCPENELVRIAQEINAVSNSHEWISKIKQRTNETEEYLVRRIVDIISKSIHWETYISPIKEWITQHQNV